MGKLINMEGKKVNKLTVLNRGPNQKKEPRWFCMCNCGNTALVLGTHLRKLIAIDCGCGKSERYAKSKRGAGNPQWKEDASYSALHQWIHGNYKKPDRCECCNSKGYVEAAKKDGYEYKKDIKSFEWLCRKCHMTKDGRLESFSKLNRGRTEPNCGYCKRD